MKYNLRVLSHDASNDTFECVQVVTDAGPQSGETRCTLPALMVSVLVNEIGEPSEFVGRDFFVAETLPTAAITLAPGVAEDDPLIGKIMSDLGFGGYEVLPEIKH